MKCSRTIGICDAKTRFRHIVHDVEMGREWIITRRGREIAKNVPIAQPLAPLATRIHHLEQSGIIEPQARQNRALPPPLPIERGLARRMLDEDLGE